MVYSCMLWLRIWGREGDGGSRFGGLGFRAGRVMGVYYGCMLWLEGPACWEEPSLEAA